MTDKKRFELRLPLALWTLLKQRAKENNRSLHGETISILKNALEKIAHGR